ncbi:hypothetical protein ACIBCT_38890 [Streptosporangium sp. NPDC050855]|uniref:hypothetical protein n=1 Tax=Streptosporangium sp. NPDC050855 TaxID=3366194 RepID=UPI0037952443
MSADAPEAPPRPEQAEQDFDETPAPEPTAAGQSSGSSEQAERGTPAGQLLLGTASLLTVGGLGLYQGLGAFGLAAGGVGTVACAGGYGLYRWRRFHPRRDRARRDRSSSPRAAHRSGGLSGGRSMFGGSTSRSGRRAVFSTGGGGGGKSGRPTGRMPSFGTPSRPGGRPDRKRMTFPTGRPHTRPPAPGTPPGPGGRRAAGGTPPRPDTVRAAVQRLANTGRTIRKRTASPRLDANAADLAHQLGDSARAARRRIAQAGKVLRRRSASPDLDQRAAELVRRAGGWVDRRTGRRLSTWWARLTTRWPWLSPRSTTGGPDAAPATAGDSSAEPSTPAAPVTRTMPIPTPTTLALTPRRYIPMSHGSPLAAISGQMVASVSRYLPMDMWEVARDLDQLPQLPENVAMALRTVTRNLEAGYPIDPRIVQMLGEFYTALAKTSAMAEQIGVAFRRIHADDIKRREAPRTGEHLWNV